MPKSILLYFLLFLSACKTSHVYVVRHAEKETNTMISDVPLSAAGKERALALAAMLGKRPITHFYSTNYSRTFYTIAPLADAKGVLVEIYSTVDSAFIEKVKSSKGSDVLIAGHSNTVDDIVNRLTGEKTLTDLADSAYGDLFILTRKKGQYQLTRKRFGQ
jgi:broad specificity phosphatase PhoE